MDKVKVCLAASKFKMRNPHVFLRSTALIVSIGVLGLSFGCLASPEDVFRAVSWPAKFFVASEQARISGWLLAIIWGIFISRLQRPDIRFNAAYLLVSVLISAALIFGSLYNSGISLEALQRLRGRCIFLSILLGFVALCLYLLLCTAARALRNRGSLHARRFVLRRKSLIIVFALLVGFWSPYVVIFAPGTVSWDMSVQLDQYFGLGNWSSHHPLASTLLYGFLYDMGVVTGGGGTFFVCMIQLLILAFACTFEIYILQLLFPSRIYLGIALGFFLLCPIFGAYCQWLVKDTLFGACFIVFSSLFSLAVVRADIFNSRMLYMIALAASVVFVGLLRNNGAYIAIIGGIALLIATKENWLRWMRMTLILSIVAIPVINQSLLVALDANLGSEKEMLSVPFQQTARYALIHGAEATEDERAAIEAVLGPYGTLGEHYDPVISDPVKERYMNLKGADYFEAWISQGSKSPLTYADAFCEGTYGYWSVVGRPAYFKFDQQIAMLERPSGDYQQDYFCPFWLRDKVYQAIMALRDSFPLGIFLQVGFYTLALTASVGLTCGGLKSDKKYLVVLIPCAVLLLTCLMSPLNGSLRYAFGLIATTPLMLGAFAKCNLPDK